jgi:hypothetical protein
MVATSARLVAAGALCLGIAGSCLAQTSPAPGPTVPPKTLPVPKTGDNMLVNPTQEECKAGWRPELKWSKEQFDKHCAQLEISK